MLDDIYDKLDEKRFKKLILLVSGENYGQVFITDTHKQRIEQLFNETEANFNVYIVNDAEIKIQEHA